MGKDFDSQDGASANPQQAQAWHYAWAVEALRVLKPGGYCLAFGGTRTYHRLASGLEDAGFEIRDTVSWVFGSGFPKSLDVSKAIDKAAGAERTVEAGVKPGHESFVDRTDAHSAGGRSEGWERDWRSDPDAVRRSHMTFAPATEDAARWSGWGTALKPAYEPIVVARKPLVSTVAKNVLEHGTGALNIDGCRIGYEDGGTKASNPSLRESITGGNGGHVIAHEDERRVGIPAVGGRWPANVMLGHHEDCEHLGARRVKGSGQHHGRSTVGGNGQTLGAMEGVTGRDHVDPDGLETVDVWECHPDCPVRLLDEQSGVTKSQGRYGTQGGVIYGNGKGIPSMEGRQGEEIGYGDTGGASRYFASFKASELEAVKGLPIDQERAGFRYAPKASTAERNAGLVDFPSIERPGDSSWIPKCSGCGKVLQSNQQVSPCCQAERVWDTPTARANVHPTVKPIDAMRWLCRLVCPPGGTILDPFTGSGTTGIAAILEGFNFVGFERDPEYVPIARQRIAWWSEHPTHLPVERALAAEAKRQKIAESGQTSLL